MHPGIPVVEFLVEPFLSGSRIDSFLARHLRNYTSWRLHRLVASGLACIDDHPAEPADRVFTGQSVRIRLIEPPDKLLQPSPPSAPIPIIYQDPWLIVVDKPAGIVAHPVGDFQDGTLSNILQWHLDRQSRFPGLLRPGVVHRLDRMTSGLIVAATEHLAHRLLSIDFQQSRISKSYTALVEGSPGFESRTIDLPIGRYPGGNSVLMSARPDALSPRPARTKVTVVERCRGYSRVECVLYTGRNHQIRVHLAQLGHPVLGDEYYGANGTIRQSPRFDDEEPLETRHALHACSLSFLHPILRQWLTFRSSPPADFQQLTVPFDTLP
ncbi:MAG: Ribosomal large subunit pseudouridine synthase [Planctomycetota bacterium]